jgi:hypothetical protein
MLMEALAIALGVYVYAAGRDIGTATTAAEVPAFDDALGSRVTSLEESRGAARTPGAYEDVVKVS